MFKSLVKLKEKLKKTVSDFVILDVDTVVELLSVYLKLYDEIIVFKPDRLDCRYEEVRKWFLLKLIAYRDMLSQSESEYKFRILFLFELVSMVDMIIKQAEGLSRDPKAQSLNKLLGEITKS